MIAAIVVIIFIILLIVPVLFYNKKIDSIKLRCDLNPYSELQRGDGYVIINEILDQNCRKELVDKFYDKAKSNKKLNEDIEVSLYTDPKFINQLSEYPCMMIRLMRKRCF